MKLADAIDADRLYQNHLGALVKLAGNFVAETQVDKWVIRRKKRFIKFAKKRWRTELDSHSYFATERTLYFFLALELLKYARYRKWGGLFWKENHQLAFIRQLEHALIEADLHQQLKTLLYEPKLSDHSPT